MNIIICGGGRVGAGIAEKLSQENNAVTIVDLSPDLIADVTTRQDVRGIVGHGSHPDILRQAGADNADMIIAVTHSDEVNMMACQISHSLFEVPTKVARVRAQAYLDPAWNDLYSRENMPIDIIISPEIEVGKAILRRLDTPGAFNIVPFGDNRVQLIGVHILDNCPIIDTPLNQLEDLFPDIQAAVVGIKRDKSVFAPAGSDQLLPGDEAYFVVDALHANRLLELLGTRADHARHIVVIGGGNIGTFVAKELEKLPGMKVRVVERDQAAAEACAEQLTKTIVLHGDAMDASILDEAGVARTEAVLCLTNDDKANILASVMSKSLGAKQALALINDVSLHQLKSALGIDVMIDPRISTVSSILRHVRRGRILDLYSIEDGVAEVMEGEVLDSSPMVGKTVADIAISGGIRFGAIIRDNHVKRAASDTVIKSGDKIVLLAERDSLKKVEQLFRVSLEYF